MDQTFVIRLAEHGIADFSLADDLAGAVIRWQ